MKKVHSDILPVNWSNEFDNNSTSYKYSQNVNKI